MYPPGMVHPYSSANSSRADLSTLRDEGNTTFSSVDKNTRPSQPRTRSSTHSSLKSLPSIVDDAEEADNASFSGPPTLNQTHSHSQSYSRLPPGADLTSENPSADDSAWVYMTIQLYSIEKEFYLVDFKCAGYERVMRKLVRDEAPTRAEDERAEKGRAYDDAEDDDEVDEDDGDGVAEHEEILGHGRATWEKKVSSPFPFLDVASRLIIQLAEAE